MDGSKKKIKHSPVHVGVVAVSQLGYWVKDVGRLVRKINCGVRMQGDYLSLGTKGFWFSHSGAWTAVLQHQAFCRLEGGMYDPVPVTCVCDCL